MPVLQVRSDGSVEKVLVKGERDSSGGLSGKLVVIGGASEGHGTSFPTSPNPGQLFYRTDLGESFYYDSDRSKWLGLNWHSVQVGYTGTGIAGNYFRTAPDFAITDSRGIYIRYDGTIVGFVYKIDAAQAGNFEITRDGVTVLSVDHSVEASGAEFDLDQDFDGEGILGARNSATATNVEWPLVVVYWRRRAE